MIPLIISALALPVLAIEKSCKALVMSGGGAWGSYEAGVLYGLIQNSEDKEKFAYDVVTGVSIGSINTAAISVFKVGDETNFT